MCCYSLYFYAVVVHAVKNSRCRWLSSIGGMWVLAVAGWAANMPRCAVGSHRQTGASLNTWHEVLGDWHYSVEGWSHSDCANTTGYCQCTSLFWLICTYVLYLFQALAFVLAYVWWKHNPNDQRMIFIVFVLWHMPSARDTNVLIITSILFILQFFTFIL